VTSLRDSVAGQRRRENTRALWLRQHGRLEKSFRDSLRTFFRDQAHRVAQAIREAGHVAAVPLLLDWQQEHSAFMRRVERGMLGAMLAGADRELSAAQRSKAADQFGFDAGDALLDIPPGVAARIRQALAESAEAIDWSRVARETQGRIARIVADGLASGDGQRQIVSAVDEQLGDLADGRALRIARTETTAGLNAGHDAARQELIDDGLITSVEWVSVLDGATRETHAELDGSTVAAGQQFNVGGELAPYPGWFGLSAENRANCRCVAVSGSAFSD
jgi:uncharacterized protein with gpF-like domain